MKKLAVLMALVLGLAGLCAASAYADAETTRWPARDMDTGLWGYIDETGVWAIAPQYAMASHFHGGCAIVDMAQHTDASMQGIIDETGAFLLAPAYELFCAPDFAYDPGDIFFVMDEEGRMGWFNVPNRYFSGVHWDECFVACETPYVMVSENDETVGLADRATGEIVVPMEYSYTGLYDWGIAEDFIAAERADTGERELIEIGKGTVTLPENVSIDYYPGIAEDLLPFVQDGLYGYLDTAGRVVIEAQFDWAEDFIDGYAEVVLGGTTVVIDRNGRMVLQGIGSELGRGYWGLRDGALFVMWLDGDWGLVEKDGTVRCRHTLPDGAYDVWLHEFSADGPIWLEYSLGDDLYTWGLMSREGELLSESKWSWVSRREGEPWLVVSEDGEWMWNEFVGTCSYVDAYGKEVLPAVYAWAEPFDGALAFVQDADGWNGYITRSGETVYRWVEDPEPETGD